MRIQASTGNNQKSQKPRPPGIAHFDKVLILWCILLLAVSGVFEIVLSHQATKIPEIKSGIAGYCLDTHRDSTVQGAAIDTWGCNGTDAQDWTATTGAITHDKKYCLSIAGNGSTAGDKIVSDKCNGSSGQVWVAAIDGYENPSSALCLQAPASKTKVQLALASCSSLTQPDEAWMPATWSREGGAPASTACSGTEGQQVACYAAKQWVAWRTGPLSHNALLNTYTDGNGYEEWCADFVSYIYKQAGYPFTNGERNGWDEYLADNIQNMGFTYHAAAGYEPQAGDIAYFDYPGGHVEIVAVGGAKPIFIYGDSGTTDPATGNGNMAENTITSDPVEGQLIYYLSPN